MILERQKLVNAAKRLARLQATVEIAGAMWDGIQVTADSPSRALVLFHGPSGSTLALKMSEITVEAVQDKIRRSEAEFQ